MGKGSNTTTTNSTSSGTSSATPDANAYAAYQALLNRASGVAATPYQGYTGQEVAPINAQQTAGIGTINNTVANNHPLTASDIQQYMNPYTNDVVNATQADFDVQNQRANSAVTGNAAAAGALGGDRVAVAQALTQEAQNRTQAPVIAGLRSSAYQSGLGAAQQQQQFGFTSGLQGANAQIGAGTLQQQTQQAQDTQNRQDYYQKQGYPFQVAQWLAAIDTGVGSQMGGTSNSTNTGTGTTEGPTPNMFTQLAGLGLAGAALWPKARGGGVTGRRQGLAGGGVPTPYGDQFQGWVPTAAGITGGRGAPQAPSANLITPAAPKAQSIGLDATQMKGLGAIGKGITNSSFGDSMSDYMQDLQEGDAGSIGSYFARGGRIGYAEGGAPGDDYNTPLNGADEQAFQAWKMLNAPRDSGTDYDMRGAFKAGLSPAANGHWVDTFKKPNHGTFSDESRYATGANRDRAGFWTGPNHDIFVPHAPMQRGGRVRRYASGGVARGYEDGGAPEDDVSFDDRFGAAFPHRMTAGIGASVPAFNDRYGHEDDFFNVPTPEQGLRMQEKGFELKGEPVINAGEAPFELNPTGTRASLDQASQDNGPKIAAAARSAGLAPPVAAQNDNGLPPLIRAGVSRPPAEPDEGSSTALGYDSSPGMRRGLAPPASTPTPSSDEGEGGLSGLLGKVGIHVTPEMRQGLLQAGLAMMATTRGGPGSFLGGLGEGGLRGAAAYGNAMEATRQEAERNRKELFEVYKYEHRGDMTDAQEAADKRAQAEQAQKQRESRIWEASQPYRLNAKGIPERNPDYIPLQTELQEAKGGPQMSEEAANLLADRLRAGDDKATVGLGKGVQGSRELKRIQALVAEREAAGIPINPLAYTIMANKAQQQAASKALGSQTVRAANVESSINEANKTFPLLEDASNNLWRTSSPLLNKPLSWAQWATGNTAQREFHAAIQGSITAYSQAMSRTGANTVNAQHHAEALFSKTDSHESIMATIGQLKKEMQAAKDAPEETSKDIIDKMLHKNTLHEASTAADEVAKAAPGGKPTPTQADRDYVKANPEARAKFIKRFGVEP